MQHHPTRRYHRPAPRRAPGPSALLLLAALVLLLVAALPSCLFDTKTTLCEASGLRCKPGQVCAAFQNACVDEGGCADGVRSADEACDDGNIIDGDGCNARCDSNETCGNGIVDLPAGEECDPSIPGTTSCSANCLLERCGNRVLDPREVCDDGNQESGDGCSADCSSNEACGNNAIDIHLGEECEFESSPFPLFPEDTRLCDSDCTLPVCGDGHVNPATEPRAEECDPGEVGANTATCDSDCSAVSCGDGHLNTDAMEQCDNGVNNSNYLPDACRTDCKRASCGDGVTDAGEACDDHNPSSEDDCPTGVPLAGGGCQLAYCGDGFLKRTGSNTERCDPGGNGRPAVGCSSGSTCRDSCSRCETNDGGITLRPLRAASEPDAPASFAARLR